MLEEFLELNAFVFILIFARIGTVLMFIPGLGSTRIFARSRLFLALAISFILTPILVDVLPAMPQTPVGLGLIIMGEILAGAFLGLIVRAMFAATQTAGTVISFVSAMANTMVYDPVVEQQSAVVAGFMGTVATLLLFVTNMHHLLIEAMVESYTLFQPGVAPNIGDMVHMLARQIADTFALGVQLASPFLVVSLAYYMGLGVLTRLAPQIPIFFVAMPLQIVISIVVLALSFGGIMVVFMRHVQENLQPFVGS
ncbi:MAG: flagellar biosynthetic protein FliR [Rhodospirillaceae bacterium]|jgi:flagellar biosynthesis protein FliR|nr:flagellar biosynthetic protein FliR [Rhodospirillaceae bacterium]MBT4588475.1 flagellar biosynthetic protein FliR [Rhodospirillaceae bacterium]MBT4940700.1 flagellar biosynthetic protein FliR [Rhodospirillaceae bacterium]MBT5938594.1 flagellar biosynthetic protein FliR [Rhodospirillaceae bacterium]MBT7265727.1 flagellar biosynthetic protein FliR [Rhodospirillaceae bacterium]